MWPMFLGYRPVDGKDPKDPVAELLNHKVVYAVESETSK